MESGDQKSERWAWARRPDLWLTLVFLSILILAIFDKFTQYYRFVHVWVCVGLLVACDARALFVRAPEDFGRRLARTLGGLAVVLAAAEIARRLAMRPEATAAEAWGAMWRFQAWLLLLAAFWLGAPLLRDRSRLLRWHAGALLLLTAWCFVTAHASLRPDRSYRYFGYEIGVYAPLYLVLLREGLRRPALRANLSRAALAAVLAAVLLTALFTALYANAGWNLRLALEQYTYTDGARLLLRQAADARTMIWRINFPFGHHNRLAIFSALAVILAALGATQARRLWVRALLALCAVLALSNLGVTLNRGAMVALAAGALAAAGGAAGRRAWPALLLLPLLIFFLPEAQRERLASLARPETYRQADSTVVLRLTHWRAAARMIADNPALGIGYGWKHFQRYYADNLAGELGLPLERVSHAHNVWLQTAAESGLPAAEFWLLWSVTRWCLLAARLRALKGLDRAARARALAWLAAEVLIQVFALGNHPLRRSVGLIVWGVWGVMTADLAAMRPRGQAAGEFQNLQDHGGDNVS